MKGISFKAVCDACGWESGWLPSTQAAQRAAKVHTDDNPHRDYADVPLFGEEQS